jgi:uncharacterized coiled-coil DUF342 family protein
MPYYRLMELGPLTIARPQNAVKAKLDLAKPNNKDSPTAQKQQALRNELSEIRQKQSAGKNSRSSVIERLKKLEEQTKSRQNELKTARSRIGPYKTTDDVDKEIARLQKQVDSGTMKLVDEKKTLADISSLHKTKKGFGGLDQQQKAIDDLKAQATELRKQLDDPASKALSDRYTTVAKELDGLRAEQDAAFKDLNTLRDQRTAAQKDQQEKWQKVKSLKDEYHGARRAFKEYENEAHRVRRERIKAEREANDAAKRRAAAKQRLDEASGPAYGDEIASAEGLIRHFDPSAAPAEKKDEESKFAAQSGRTVADDGFKGMKLASKREEEEYMVMAAKPKKGKKGKKGQNAADSGEGSKFNLSIDIIEQLGALNIDPPSSQADIPGVVEKLQEKLKFWHEDQDRKTKEVCNCFGHLSLPTVVILTHICRTFPRRRRRLTAWRLRRRLLLPLVPQPDLPVPPWTRLRSRLRRTKALTARPRRPAPLEPRKRSSRRMMLLRTRLRSWPRPRLRMLRNYIDGHSNGAELEPSNGSGLARVGGVYRGDERRGGARRCSCRSCLWWRPSLLVLLMLLDQVARTGNLPKMMTDRRTRLPIE